MVDSPLTKIFVLFCFVFEVVFVYGL